MVLDGLFEMEVLTSAKVSISNVRAKIFEIYEITTYAAKFTKIQETGSKFTTSVSSRTVIGTDIHGVVKILQFDGVSWETG